MNRKVLSLILAALMLAGASGCGSAPSGANAGEPEPEETEETEEPVEPMAMDDVVAVIETDILSAGYFDFDVSAFKYEILVLIWAENLSDSRAEKLYEHREKLLSLADDVRDFLDLVGHKDISVRLRLLYDRDNEIKFLEIVDGEIVYDALEDPASLVDQILFSYTSDPVIYTGSGDDVIEIELLEEGSAFHITGNQAGRHFSVKGYDASGKYIDLFVNTTDPYDGITLDPDQATAMLEISATGDWTVELRSVFALDTIAAGETVSGAGDSVVFVLGFGKTATITGNAEGRHFAVRSYGAERNNLMVNTTEPYEGKVMLVGQPLFLEISAAGDWSITFDE